MEMCNVKYENVFERMLHIISLECVKAILQM